MAQVLKSRSCKTLGEDIPKLIPAIEFDHLHPILRQRDELTKPMILDSIMLRMRSHPARFQLGKSQSTNIVLVDIDMQVSNEIIPKTDSIAQVTDDSNHWNQIFAICVLNATYSASIVDTAISICKLEHHTTGYPKVMIT